MQSYEKILALRKFSHKYFLRTASPQLLLTKIDVHLKRTLKYSLHIQKNLMRPEDAEKAYASLQLNNILSLEDLADHIHDHDSVFSKGTIIGVLTDMVHCIKESIKEGCAIELGDLGRFTPSLNSEGAEASEATEDQPARTAMENFTADNIKKVNVNYELGAGLNFQRDDFNFEFVTTRKVQAAAKKAQKAGQSSADWSDPEEDGNDEP